MALFFIFSLITSGFVSKTFAYLIGSLCNVFVNIVIYSKAQYNKTLSNMANYFFSSLMLFFTMYVGTITSGGVPATTFFTAIALIPYILYNKVIYGFIHRLVFLLLFFYFSYNKLGKYK